MKKYCEVRLSGAGGQGLGLAGRVLSEAAIQADYNVCQTQSYGPEARGGSSRTDVILSRNEILFPNCRNLDILLAMNQESANRFAWEVRQDGFLLLDSSYVNQVPEGHVYTYPLTNTSVEVFKTHVVANIMALGMMAALGRLFDLEIWVRVIRETVPERFIDLNLKAFEMGHKEGREILHVEEGRVPIAFDRKRPVLKSQRKNNNT